METFLTILPPKKVVIELRNQGLDRDEINIVSKGNQQQQDSSATYDDEIIDGALTGGTLGGIGGLIIGTGLLAIPGYGPIIASGPIAAALNGAVAGGIAGSLADWVIPTETRRRYEQGVAQGKVMIIIKTNSAKVQHAVQVLRNMGAADIESYSARQLI